MSRDIEAVIFDFGGVLTLQPLDHHLDNLSALSGLDRSTLAARYRRQRPDYDRGTIDAREYWSRVLDSKGELAGDEIFGHLFETDVASWTRVNQGVLDWAFRLQAAGMRTGILSNMPQAILSWIESRFRWFDRFEVKVFSCNVGVNKPETGIYRFCLNALRLEADQVLFLDDVFENVEGARRAGIRAVLFRSLDDALHRIADYGWLPENLLVKQEIR